MVKTIFKDKAGNKLYKKFIKTRDIWQYYAKNKGGKIVNQKGLYKLTKAAGITLTKPKSKKCGIHKVMMRKRLKWKSKLKS